MSIETSPFFSVCMPVTNRGKTIFDALHSVALQTCRDFELVIVDCGSQDNSREEIARFFASETYRTHSFPYRYEQRDYVPQTVEDWNEPVRLATGRYIAMLEGDDGWRPEYLQTAYNKLSACSEIGVYATGNQLRPRQRQGYLNSNELIRFIYGQTEVPPPSETIFVRTDRAGIPFLYNDTDYEYAPEIDLYMRIGLDGYAGYFDDCQNTIRDISPKDRSSWHYFHDQFAVAEKYASVFDAKARIILQNILLHRVIHTMISNRKTSTFLDLRTHIIQEVGWKRYMQVLIGIIHKNIFSRIGL